MTKLSFLINSTCTQNETNPKIIIIHSQLYTFDQPRDRVLRGMGIQYSRTNIEEDMSTFMKNNENF